MTVDVVRETVVLDAAGAEVAVAVHVPKEARRHAVLLTPGAGGDLEGDGLVALASVILDAGHVVVRSNLPHNQAGHPPRQAERAVPVLKELVRAVGERWRPDGGWVVGGKSYGGRVASLAVAEGLPAVGLLLYGYPLHRPGDPERLRADHWPSIDVPVLFLQGAADPRCDLDLLRAHLDRLAGPVGLEVVGAGDHSLEVPARANPDGGRLRARQTLRGLAPAITAWLDGIPG